MCSPQSPDLCRNYKAKFNYTLSVCMIDFTTRKYGLIKATLRRNLSLPMLYMKYLVLELIINLELSIYVQS